MEHGFKSGLFYDATGNVVQPVNKSFPLVVIHAVRWLNAANNFIANLIGKQVITDHDQRTIAGDFGHQTSSTHRPVGAVGMALRVNQHRCYPGGDQAEIPSRKFCLERRRIGGHKPPIAEFGAVKTCFLHFINDAQVVIRAFILVCFFNDSPGTGCIGNSYHFYPYGWIGFKGLFEFFFKFKGSLDILF